MSRVTGDVHLVGSVPLDDAGQVFETCGTALAPYLSALPDGEIGHRIHWIVCQAVFVFNENPGVELLHRPAPIDGKEQWLPKSYADQWKFKLKRHAEPIEFDDLKYAAWAIESYATFQALRNRGAVPRGIRFQVCLPTPLAGFQPFFDAEDGAMIHKPYAAAMQAEVKKICDAIPNDDLAIQWDVAVETGTIEKGLPAKLGGDAFEQWASEASQLAAWVPPDVWLGYHICYGDFNHRHAVEPRNLVVSVRMLNEAALRAQRPVDFVHMPVPVDRRDDAYFEPLRDLRVGDARVFLGLVHYEGGVNGTLERARTARKYLRDFGIATECGFGRRKPETLAELLRIHHDAAEQIRKL